MMLFTLGGCQTLLSNKMQFLALSILLGLLWMSREYTEASAPSLCGKNHGFMPVVVKVVPQDEYDAWVQEKKDAAFRMAELTEKDWSSF